MALGVPGAQMTIYSVDAAVHTVEKVRRARDAKLVGAGGTDMRLGFRGVEAERPRPDVVICFTDADTPWPSAPPPGAAVIAAVLGREIVMTAFVRSLLLLVYASLGVLFLVVWARPAGRTLVPTALAVLAPLTAALMASPVGLGSVFLVAAAAVIVPTGGLSVLGGGADARGLDWAAAMGRTVVAPYAARAPPVAEGATPPAPRSMR